LLLVLAAHPRGMVAAHASTAHAEWCGEGEAFAILVCATVQLKQARVGKFDAALDPLQRHPSDDEVVWGDEERPKRASRQIL
jgi:hypothetical protein